MNESLKAESEKLAQSWMQHDAAVLRDYLIADVEDPRLNLQSVLSRHFVVRAVTGERFGGLIHQEYRFAAVMNWLKNLPQMPGDAEQLQSVLHALRHASDNAEGFEIPHFVVQTFAALPAPVAGVVIPNYIENFLSGTRLVSGETVRHEPVLDTFRDLWNEALAGLDLSAAGIPRLSVLEPACGSANDYRFLRAYGIARLIDYTGFDLCLKNVENARTLFPDARFEVGNAFEIAVPDKSFDLAFVHDLFEHLSLEGMEAAMRELCRVTRRGMCIGFFSMDEVREHFVRPVEGYYWNKLSMARTKELFANRGFTAHVVHIGSFLRHQLGCELTHNPNAYTFFLQAAGGQG